MKYVYFNPVTGQVEAEFNTPQLSVQRNWQARGLRRGIVPPGLRVSRDTRITSMAGDTIATIEPFINPFQPSP